MALLYFDNFDDGLKLFRGLTNNSADFNTSHGRNGGIGFRAGDQYNDNVRVDVVPGDDTIILGFWHRIFSGPEGDVLASSLDFTSTDNGQQRNLICNGNTVSTALGLFDYPVWEWVELKIYYHASAGTMEIRRNGATVASDTGLDTGTMPDPFYITYGITGSAGVNGVSFTTLYICDGTGSYNNDFLGEVEIVTLYPSGNGNSSGMVGSDADQTDNYLLVDEVGDPSSTDYVGSSTEGDKDTYAMDDLTGSPDILAVRVSLFAGNDDAGTKYIRPLVRTASTDYAGTSVPLSTEYAGVDGLYEENPNSSAAWTASQVNSIEVGQEVRDS